MTSEAAAGLQEARLVAGEDYLIADSSESFRDAVLRLLSDRDTAERIASSARDRVARHCDWESALYPLEEIVRRVAVASPASERPLRGGLETWDGKEVAGADP
jgi:hypothetical protein